MSRLEEKSGDNKSDGSVAASGHHRLLAEAVWLVYSQSGIEDQSGGSLGLKR